MRGENGGEAYPQACLDWSLVALPLRRALQSLAQAGEELELAQLALLALLLLLFPGPPPLPLVPLTRAWLRIDRARPSLRKSLGARILRHSQLQRAAQGIRGLSSPATLYIGEAKSEA